MDERFAEPTNAVIDGENIGGSSKKRLTELLHLCFQGRVRAQVGQEIALGDGDGRLRAKIFGDLYRLGHVLAGYDFIQLTTKSLGAFYLLY